MKDVLLVIGVFIIIIWIAGSAGLLDSGEAEVIHSTENLNV